MPETKDLLLRKAVPEDWRCMYRNIWSRPESARYMVWEVTGSEEAAVARMARTVAFQAAHDHHWTVVEKASGEAIGWAGMEMREPGVWAETGVALGPAYTGRGYGKQILNLLTELARDRFGAARFAACCRRENQASQKVFLACGFTYTHSQEVMHPRDHILYILDHYEKKLEGETECYALIGERLAKKEYLPILQSKDGSRVTPETWEQRRQELLEALQIYSYGFTPPAPNRVWGEILQEDRNAYAGKVLEQQLSVSFETEKGVFSFPVSLYIPKAAQCPPVFLHLAFRPVPDRYIPVEEITDQGFALAVVCYQDMVNDKLFGDFSGGIAAHFGTTAERTPEQWGKIGMWAYGASRVLDYLTAERAAELDTEKVAVIGHSRLGKTALWTAAQDTRFWCAISNNSGYGGAASSKHGKGERVRDFLRVGSWDWYCENFKQYTDEKEDSKPYDQAYLLALIAPRLLCVGSAQEDRGADPEAEFLTALWASQAWELLGEKGLAVPKDTMPVPGDHFKEGKIGYHLRPGRHFLSREDWNHYIRFLKEKL